MALREFWAKFPWLSWFLSYFWLNFTNLSLPKLHGPSDIATIDDGRLTKSLVFEVFLVALYGLLADRTNPIEFLLDQVLAPSFRPLEGEDGNPTFVAGGGFDLDERALVEVGGFQDFDPRSLPQDLGCIRI